jgi:uncharacterized Fe-S radical SAM superfamily protein PflX
MEFNLFVGPFVENYLSKIIIIKRKLNFISFGTSKENERVLGVVLRMMDRYPMVINPNMYPHDSGYMVLKICK